MIRTEKQRIGHAVAEQGWRDYYNGRVVAPRNTSHTPCRRHMKLANGQVLHVTKGYRKVEK